MVLTMIKDTDILIHELTREMNSRQRTLPFHIFKEAVARSLATPPLNWGGPGAYELVEKYHDLINSFWLSADLTPEEVAADIDEQIMSKSQKVDVDAVREYRKSRIID